MRILIADEEQNVRMNLKRLLEKQGYECVTVASDREMREILESQDFDLVLTEMKLTGHDVIELIKNLRESGLKVPIVVVTAYGTPENIANAMKAGVSDYVSKPFSPEEILSKVESNIRKKDTPDKLLRNFQKYLAQGKRSAAEDLARALISNYPSRPEGYYCMGMLIEDTNPLVASKFYRASLIFDEKYEPSRKRLETLEEGKR
ncbi:MAG: response regulator [Thermotogae bacterium]|nr:response regulator [Thermotogota bacterium]